MSGSWSLWLAFVGIGLSGAVARWSFVVFGERLRLPPLAERALKHAPAAALAAIIAPALVLPGGHLELTPGNHRLVAALIAGLVMWRSHSMLWSMAAGLAAFTALRLYA